MLNRNVEWWWNARACVSVAARGDHGDMAASPPVVAVVKRMKYNISMRSRLSWRHARKQSAACHVKLPKYAHYHAPSNIIFSVAKWEQKFCYLQPKITCGNNCDSGQCASQSKLMLNNMLASINSLASYSSSLNLPSIFKPKHENWRGDGSGWWRQARITCWRRPGRSTL